MESSIADRLLQWYRINKRQLPWRQTDDPYAIWVAEIMLQQTRVETVIPYYQRWLERFPTVHALARAEEREVLNQWEGLGYYRRALNLHRAAAEVVKRFGGRLPSDQNQLQQLPGIGEYTSSAIAAFAFDRDELALDGNLRRVLARLFDVKLEPRSAAARREFERLGRSILPTGFASDFNQALMDLGSAICKPAAPACSECPLSGVCLAFAHGTQEQRPLPSLRQARREVQRQMLAIEHKGRLLLGRRPPGGLLGGMWEFPGRDLASGVLHEREAEAFGPEFLGISLIKPELVATYQHSYSHFDLTAYAYLATLDKGEPISSTHSELRWVDLDQLDSLPMGKVDRKLAADVNARLQTSPVSSSGGKARRG